MFKIKDYILTPYDFYRGILHLIGEIKKAGPKDIIGLAVLTILFFIFKYYLAWQTDSSLFMIFWIALFFWNLDSRISIAGALVCLAACPILLILFEKNILLFGEEYAEQSAVWAYYFLVIGVTKQIWEFKRESAEEKEEPEAEEKAVEKIVEKTKSVPKQADGQARQKINVAKQRIMTDIIPPKK